MQVVILCGGKGTRMSNMAETLPKPLALIGEKPILWHIMKTYSYFGFNDFILCLGYKGEKIREYFENNNNEGWNIRFADTGEETNTGGRIKRIEKFIEGSNFHCTYGDGVADINLKELVDFHKEKKIVGTITITKPVCQFGIVKFNEKSSIVDSFIEKPLLSEWINGGFFVFEREFFDYLNKNDVLEKEPLVNLTKNKQLAAYMHKGFWRCMDTIKDNMELNDLWNNSKAPWKIWSDRK